MRVSLLAQVSAVGSASLLADNIPYANPGQFAPARTFTACPADLDYNDDTFIFTNISDPAVPEPNTLALLGTGVLSAAGLFRRRMLNR